MFEEDSILVAYTNQPFLRSRLQLPGRAMSRSTAFQASQPSKSLSPNTIRQPYSPPTLDSLSRSSSLRSIHTQSTHEQTTTETEDKPLPEVPSSSAVTNARPEPLKNISAAAFSQPTIQTPPGYSSRTSSLKPRSTPSPLQPRKRSWFREEDPSAFAPPSPDPAALSPMATFRSSMSEDEQKEDLLSETFSRPPSSSSRAPSPANLSPYQQYHHAFKQQSEVEEMELQRLRERHENRPYSMIGDTEFLTLPARARSGSTRSMGSAPALVLNDGKGTTENTRRASDGANDPKTVHTPVSTEHHGAAGIERSSSLVSAERSQKKSVWERALRRGPGEL